MRVSQLLNVMDKDEEVVIDDANKMIRRMRLYSGPVRGIKKDNSINKMHVVAIVAQDDVIYVCAQA